MVSLADEDGLTVGGSFAGDDLDAENDISNLVYTIINDLPLGSGAVTNNGDGTFTFDPKQNVDFQQLAKDESSDVRRNVADNPNTSVELLQQLAKDVFGAQGDPVRVPDWLVGTIPVFGYNWPYRQIFTIVLALAIIGSFMNSYTADKYDSLMKAKFSTGKGIRIGRDVRIFLIFLCALCNLPFATLLVLAILMNVETIRRVVVCYYDEQH